MEDNKRQFVYNGQRLADLDPTKEPGDIKKMYESEYPELTTAIVATSIKGGVRVHEFKKSAGTKG